MIAGIGVDIVENRRFSNKPRGFLERIFTDNELLEGLDRRGEVEFLASRFAAKEAFVKALGTGFGKIQPKDIEIREDSLGRPSITLLKEIPVMPLVHLSISHEKEYSVAMVVLEDA